MTRREEIQWEAGGIVNRMVERGVSQCYDTYYQAFQDGATWADKTMIEKACELLEDIDYVMQYQYSEDGCTFFNKDKFIKDFRKAMEE
jgi:hypothetical protein